MEIIIWALLLTGISTLFIYLRFMMGINSLKKELKQTKRQRQDLEEKYVRQTKEMDLEVRARNRKMELLENKLQKLQTENTLKIENTAEPETENNGENKGEIAQESSIKTQQFIVFEQQTEEMRLKYEALLAEKQAEIDKLKSPLTTEGEIKAS